LLRKPDAQHHVAERTGLCTRPNWPKRETLLIWHFGLRYAGKSCPSSGKSSCGGGKNFTITVLSNNGTQ
jgi:hypothetical protein